MTAAARAGGVLLASGGRPPTTEKGTSAELSNRIIGSAARSWHSFLGDALELAPEWKWPTSVATAHTMRGDAQVQGLYLGCTLPIRRYNWFIEPNGAEDSIVEAVAKGYNLPIRGREREPRGRRKGRFAFNDHLRHVLLALIYGHMYFEQSGEIIGGLWVPRKLGPRMPHTILQINMEKDGGLKSIIQQPIYGGGTMWQKNEIKVNRLIAYIWEQEGANWAGRSMLRGIYKNWLMKDVVLRVGAINIERAGGVPVITGPKGASPDDLEELAKMARQFRVGEGSGGAIPNGAELQLARSAGGEEAVNYIKLQNEEMGRGFLMMFMNLGQATTGSYALGSSLIDYVLNTQETIANWICDIFNEHQIEDHVDWNWGEETENVPTLGYSRRDDKQMALGDLSKAVEQNLITLDDELEDWIREEFNMPRRNPSLQARSTSSGAADGTDGEGGAEAENSPGGSATPADQEEGSDA